MARALRTALMAWAAWRLLGPQLPPRFPGTQERPSRLTGRSVLVGHRELFLREAGPPDGSPVLLVHGLGADSLLNWHLIIPRLAELHRVVAVDLRDHGRSEWVWEQFRFDRLAEDVVGVMDALDIGQAAVAGYSMGGMVAQAIAHRHPHRVSKLLLAATAAHVSFRGQALRRPLFVLGRALERFSPVEGTWLRYRYVMRAGAVEPRHARWLWETLRNREFSLSYGAAFATLDFDSREWVGRLDQPTLVVIPTADRLVAPSAQRELADRLPKADAVELEGAGHEACLTHADRLAEAMLDFLA